MKETKKAFLKRIRSPEFKAEVKRYTAKLGAEEQGWAVISQNLWTALMEVAFTAKAFHKYVHEYSDPVEHLDLPLKRALNKLYKLRREYL